MIINRAYIFRIYPNLEQKILIEKSFGVSRYIYNYYLEKSQSKYQSAFDNIKDVKLLSLEKEWLKEVDSCLLRTSIFDLDNAYQKYFKKEKDKPTFKSKARARKSYRTNNITSEYKGKQYNSIEINLKEKLIKLPKLKEIKIRGYRNITKIGGRIINATVYKEANKYFVSVCVEESKIIPNLIHKNIIGIDLGIKELLTTSDGYKIDNKKYITKYEKKLKGLNRALARSQKGSKNRKKIILKLQIVYKKLKNARKFFLHKTANALLKDNDIIVCENLKVKEMIQKKTLSKEISDASWSELIRILDYKTKWQNKDLIKIDTYYPSSQICNRCGYQNKDTKNLNIREWVCPSCQSNLDRDINASINILFEGIKIYMKKLIEN